MLFLLLLSSTDWLKTSEQMKWWSFLEMLSKSLKERTYHNTCPDEILVRLNKCLVRSLCTHWIFGWRWTLIYLNSLLVASLSLILNTTRTDCFFSFSVLLILLPLCAFVLSLLSTHEMIIMIMMIFFLLLFFSCAQRALSLSLSFFFSSQLFFAKGEHRRIYLEFEHIRDVDDYRKRLTSVLIEMKSNSKQFLPIDMLWFLVSNIVSSILQGFLSLSLSFCMHEDPSIITCFDYWWWEQTRESNITSALRRLHQSLLVSLSSQAFFFFFFYWSLNE